MTRSIALLLSFFIASQQLYPSTLKVACASSFAPVLKKVLEKASSPNFQAVKVIPGSTGKLFSQIMNAAPYDIFLAADQKHPRLLIKHGKAHGESFIYAKGQLSFWFGKKRPKGKSWHENIKNTLASQTIAMPNPKHAPFGIAAQYILDHNFAKLSKKVLFGANAAQTFLYISQRPDLAGFVSLSHLKTSSFDITNYIVIPPKYYPTIAMSGVKLRNTSHEKLASEFINYLMQVESQKIISQNGFIQGIAYD